MLNETLNVEDFMSYVDASLYSFCFAFAIKLIKETDGKEEGVAKIETTTDELKPSTGEKAKSSDKPDLSPASEKEEPLFKSSLRIKSQLKPKVSRSEGKRPMLYLFLLVTASP